MINKKVLLILFFITQNMLPNNAENFTRSKKDFEHLEELHQEYIQNNNHFNKELARMERLGYQNIAGYALYLVIDLLGKTTKTSEAFEFVGIFYAMFFAVNLWEASKSTRKIIKYMDKSKKIENQIARINTQLLNEKYDRLKQKTN